MPVASQESLSYINSSPTGCVEPFLLLLNPFSMQIFCATIRNGDLRCAYLALALLFGFPYAEARPQHAVTRFTTNQGLAQNMIISMHLDSRGFLWCGSKSGLSRYDGYTFHN